jgi:hypothetical protein
MLGSFFDFLGRLGRSLLADLLDPGWFISQRVDRLLRYALVVVIAAIIGYLWIARGL